MKIFYGISQDNSIDVTDICLDRLTINNIINKSKKKNLTIYKSCLIWIKKNY